MANNWKKTHNEKRKGFMNYYIRWESKERGILKGFINSKSIHKKYVDIFPQKTREGKKVHLVRFGNWNEKKQVMPTKRKSFKTKKEALAYAKKVRGKK